MIIKHFPIDDKIAIPKGGRILYCDEWQGCIHCYVLCSTTESELEEVEFMIIGNDRAFEKSNWLYLSSVRMTSTWHVFYRYPVSVTNE